MEHEQRNQTQIINVWLYLYEVQEKAKLTYIDRNKNGSYFWVSGVGGFTWKGHEGASWSAGNIPYMSKWYSYQCICM